jgi:Flp pilus assembly protein TadG
MLLLRPRLVFSILKRRKFISLRKRSQSGAVYVEFAFVMLILIPLFLALVDFSFAFLNKIVITNAAREGVRVAVRFERAELRNICDSENQAAVAQVVNSYVSNNLVTFGNEVAAPVVTVTKVADDAARPACRVVITYEYRGLFWFNSGGLRSEVTMGV